MLHWALALNLIFALLRLLAGLSTSLKTCAGLAASAGLWRLIQVSLLEGVQCLSDMHELPPGPA